MDKLATTKYQKMLARKRIKVTKRGKPESFTAKLELYYIILISYLFNCILLSKMLCFVINVFMCLFFSLALKGIFFSGWKNRVNLHFAGNEAITWWGMISYIFFISDVHYVKCDLENSTDKNHLFNSPCNFASEMTFKYFQLQLMWLPDCYTMRFITFENYNLLGY